MKNREIEDVRRFNRFYTQVIGVLREGLLESPYSLTEVRVMYELFHRDSPTAADLTKDLGLDAGYLSRILKRFEKSGLLLKSVSASDGRKNRLALTAKGQKTFLPLNESSREQVAKILESLPAARKKTLLRSMRSIEEALRPDARPETAYVLRGHRSGDLGWIVHRHGALYAREYGWDERFEALVAEIVAAFIKNFDAKRERCWVAERDGEIVGSVFLVKKSARVAQLRLLLVEPSARGLGIGRHLVKECEEFARAAGYREMTLWTNDVLHSARRIYEAAGFRLTRSERHRSFGKSLVGQFWKLDLLNYG